MIFVFGNGLSVGFDFRLTTESITGRVVASLGDSYAGVLRDLAELGTPEDPDTAPVGVARGGSSSWPAPWTGWRTRLWPCSGFSPGPARARC